MKEIEKEIQFTKEAKKVIFKVLNKKRHSEYNPKDFYQFQKKRKIYLFYKNQIIIIILIF